MKAGCFIKGLVIVTILVAATLYVISNYWSEIENYGKKRIVEYYLSKLDDSIDSLKSSTEKTELINTLHSYKQAVLLSKKIETNKLVEVVDSLNIIVQDHQLSTEKLIEIKEYLQEAIENETGTKDGN
ncbi:MAG: hypothetical protein LWX56_14880 [Ignavibacteria bacterium]|nr:hypothetical protein [Ignavibacteria bacterium]